MQQYQTYQPLGIRTTKTTRIHQCIINPQGTRCVTSYHSSPSHTGSKSSHCRNSRNILHTHGSCLKCNNSSTHQHKLYKCQTIIPRIRYFKQFMNIQGLCPQTVPSKVPSINDLISENNNLLKNHTERQRLMAIHSFRFSLRDKIKSNQGRATAGVAFYLRDDLAVSSELTFEHATDEFQIVCLYSKVENLIIVPLPTQHIVIPQLQMTLRRASSDCQLQFKSSHRCPISSLAGILICLTSVGQQGHPS